jgi:hypothetical protein
MSLALAKVAPVRDRFRMTEARPQALESFKATTLRLLDEKGLSDHQRYLVGQHTRNPFERNEAQQMLWNRAIVHLIDKGQKGIQLFTLSLHELLQLMKVHQ